MRRAESSLSRSLRSAFRDSISSTARSAAVPRASSTADSRWSRARAQAIAPWPVSASIRRTPEATPRSAVITNRPISPVLVTWQPPQSSMLKPGTSTVRTRSPYFSPKSAIAPSATASS